MWTSVRDVKAAVEPAVRQFVPPCQMGCPINEDIQRTNVLISLLPEDPHLAHEGIIQIGDYLYEKNPFFTVCGYVCGLCELLCNYHDKGGAIRRRLLKRFISDTYTYYMDKKPAWKNERNREPVAIVGGGPAGLSCGYELSRRGYPVTVFEASGRLGGALWLIPRYRLPEKVLSASLESLVRIAGIEVRFNSRVGEGDLTLETLRQQGFAAVFVAEGAPAPRTLTFGGKELDGQDYSGVMYGHTFLYEVSHGNIAPNYFRGKKVVVVGGGNVAFDVARTARRLAGDTTLVCLERLEREHRDGIQADPEEVRGAWEEGIRILYSRGVSGILGRADRIVGVECPVCTSVFNECGFNPEFNMADRLRLDADVLIITVGQGPEESFLRRENLVDERGRVPLDPLTLQSAKKPWVFVGGDLKRPGFMVDAMKDGTVAAESIERHLRGLDLAKGRRKHFAPQDIPRRRFYESEPEVLWIPPEKRMHFQVFERGFTLPEAVEEARRCLSCGPCMSCMACVSVGIQEALSPVKVIADRCSGCGLCVSACYFDACSLREVDGAKRSVTEELACKSCGMCVVACPSAARHMQDDPFARNLAGVLARLEANLPGSGKSGPTQKE
jgi:NADPH-dependent glutamate synthase beta subunit-like oxidoreductase/NAD-dependent dihydropyrimidine dehydrogenase PreA subunit